MRRVLLAGVGFARFLVEFEEADEGSWRLGLGHCFVARKGVFRDAGVGIWT